MSEEKPTYHEADDKQKKTKVGHSIWYGILTRCYNKKNHDYKYYGARGVTMCDEWRHSFTNFQTWLITNGYAVGCGLSVDRYPDNKGNYCPSNCRLATQRQQGNNRVNNVFFELNGEKKTIAEWAYQYGVNRKTTHTRVVRDGWDLLTALTTKERLSGYKKRQRNKKGQFI